MLAELPTKYNIDSSVGFVHGHVEHRVTVILAFAAQFDLEVHLMDVKTAFLNGVLAEEVYMDQPKGFTVKGKENMVCHLHKTWLGLMNTYLTCIGF